MAEAILKAAAQGHTSYNELLAAATDQIQVIVSTNVPAPTTFTPFYEKLKNSKEWTVHTLPCTHIVQMELPDELTCSIAAGRSVSGSASIFAASAHHPSRRGSRSRVVVCHLSVDPR